MIDVNLFFDEGGKAAFVKGFWALTWLDELFVGVRGTKPARFDHLATHDKLVF